VVHDRYPWDLGHAPQEMFENIPSEIESGTFSEPKIVIV